MAPKSKRQSQVRNPRTIYSMHKNPALTVDAVIMKDGKIVLIKRGAEPFQGYYALPGGFVEYGETVEAALRREVLEETGLVVEISSLVGIYSDPNRDPRGHVISAAFAAVIVSGALISGSDAAEAGLWKITNLPPLAFDHAQIVQDALRRR
jgi:8-oxo-dGTP diphosphatase